MSFLSFVRLRNTKEVKKSNAVKVERMKLVFGFAVTSPLSCCILLDLVDSFRVDGVVLLVSCLSSGAPFSPLGKVRVYQPNSNCWSETWIHKSQAQTHSMTQ